MINIYTDYRLDGDESLSQEQQQKLDSYVSRLEEILKLSTPITEQLHEQTPRFPWQMWADGLNQLIKEIYYDAFKSRDILREGDEGRVDGIELYIAGSLAKSQATPYSDFDAFCVFKDDEAKEKSRPVFSAVNNLMQRIFVRHSQLYPDPIGINPERLAGTFEQLSQKIQEGFEVDQKPTLTSVMTSKPLWGSAEEGEKLKATLLQDEQLKQQISAKALYRRAIDDFPAPRDDEEVSLKIHLLRPLDFILMGLRAEFPEYFVDAEDGKYLDALKTIEKLNTIPADDSRKPSYEVIKALKETFIGAMTLRFNQHCHLQRESDDVERNENINDMLHNVAILRTYFTSRSNELDNSLSGYSNSNESFSHEHYTQKTKARSRFNVGLLTGLAILGFVVGVALVATGFLAPLGAGFLGYTAIAGGGLLTGLFTAAAVAFGIKKFKPISKPKFAELETLEFKSIALHYPQPIIQQQSPQPEPGVHTNFRSRAHSEVKLGESRHALMGRRRTRSVSAIEELKRSGDAPQPSFL